MLQQISGAARAYLTLKKHNHTVYLRTLSLLTSSYVAVGGEEYRVAASCLVIQPMSAKVKHLWSVRKVIIYFYEETTQQSKKYIKYPMFIILSSPIFFNKFTYLNGYFQGSFTGINSADGSKWRLPYWKCYCYRLMFVRTCWIEELEQSLQK